VEKLQIFAFRFVVQLFYLLWTSRKPYSLFRFVADLLSSPQQIHSIWTCRDIMDLLWICRKVVDLLWICCTTCCKANPQQIEQAEFELYTANTDVQPVDTNDRDIHATTKQGYIRIYGKLITAMPTIKIRDEALHQARTPPCKTVHGVLKSPSAGARQHKTLTV
jgi:hypothetical protein